MAEEKNELNIDTKTIVETQSRNMILVNKMYIQKLNYMVEEIEKVVNQKEKDRLDYAFIINECVKALFASTEGWKKWCDIRTMHIVMSEEELKEFAPRMFELMKKWIEIDVEITKRKIVENEKKLEKTSGESSRKKENYVS